MTEVMREEIRKNVQTFKVQAILEDVYYPIEIELNTGESQNTIAMVTINEAKKLLADLETEIEIIEWEEVKKRRANPDPEVSEKRVFAEKMGLQPSSVYNW
jgi:hypothetical protein